MSILFEPRRDLSLSFATPIARMQVKEASDINPGIRQAILEKESACQSTVRSNVGGWHSAEDLLDWPGPDIQTLKATMRDAAIAMTRVAAGKQDFDTHVTLRAWANVTRHGGYHQPHTHPHNHWSGVYYVDAGRTRPGRRAARSRSRTPETAPRCFASPTPPTA